MGTVADLTDLPVLPAGLHLGASTAAYQIEGGADADGRGPSVWDTFCAEPGRVEDGSSGAVACDSYHRSEQDVALLRDLGVTGYRFSIAWPRVQPDGVTVNPAGLAYYDRLVDDLLAAGVAPMATLFHWDLPQALQDAHGGWRSRETAERFAAYAAVVGERLADRVAHWCPVNEPNVVTTLGHGIGVHAPGLRLGLDALPVAHHLLLGHGLAVQALRTAGAGSVGTANNHAPAIPATDSAEDRAATDLYDALWNRLFADPVLLGRYPDGFEDLMPPAAADDLAVIGAPVDFYGFNYYAPTWVSAPGGAASPTQPEIPAEIGFAFADPPATYARTDFGWPVVASGLRDQIGILRERYPDLPPLYITEQGCSYATPPGSDGAVPDTDRIAYLDAHLRAVADAVADGADVRGYYVWSLLDNFEWAEGYTQRFGLVWVDFETLERTPKASYHWLRDVIAAQTGPS